MPFNRFRQPDGRYVDTVLGPEMKSTGEVMGIDRDFRKAYVKSQIAAGSNGGLLFFHRPCRRSSVVA